MLFFNIKLAMDQSVVFILKHLLYWTRVGIRHVAYMALGIRHVAYMALGIRHVVHMALAVVEI